MRISNLFLLTLLASTEVHAADLIVDEVPTSPAVFSWGGAYVGINGGYGGGSFDHPLALYGRAATEAPVFPAPDELEQLLGGAVAFTAGGFIGGAQVGYNFQQGDHLVYGVEADVQAASIKGEVSGNFAIPAGIVGGATDGDARVGTSLDWFATLRGRVGYTATERLLVYGTGGFAYGRTESFIDVSVNGGELFEASRSNSRTGWTVGGGVEYAVTDHITLKSEYLYTDLGSKTLFEGDVVPGSLYGLLKSNVAFHAVRVGLNYKF